MSLPPGAIRDQIIAYLSSTSQGASLTEIEAAVARQIGPLSSSSIRSYLNNNTPTMFERVGRGRYRLKIAKLPNDPFASRHAEIGLATLHRSDAFEWLERQPSNSIHAVVTDPPYGLVEYTAHEQGKLRNGNRGGIWRIPPSFDGHARSPLPRFTVLDDDDRRELYAFFHRFGVLLNRVTVPGANIVVAANPLLSHIVATAMSEAGLELRGYITRLVQTMRGGDRPKNAHEEFHDVSVMPRSQHEPWVVLRKPLEGRVQDNLRKWGTGGFRRISAERPFGDVIKSRPTPASEKRIAAHPSLKPQDLLRKLVRGSLPLGEGIVLDPFAGSGSTLAAANAVGYRSVGTEFDDHYFDLAVAAIPKLAALPVEEDPILP